MKKSRQLSNHNEYNHQKNDSIIVSWSFFFVSQALILVLEHGLCMTYGNP